MGLSVSVLILPLVVHCAKRHVRCQIGLLFNLAVNKCMKGWPIRCVYTGMMDGYIWRFSFPSTRLFWAVHGFLLLLLYSIINGNRLSTTFTPLIEKWYRCHLFLWGVNDFIYLLEVSSWFLSKYPLPPPDVHP